MSKMTDVTIPARMAATIVRCSNNDKRIPQASSSTPSSPKTPHIRRCKWIGQSAGQRHRHRPCNEIHGRGEQANAILPGIPAWSSRERTHDIVGFILPFRGEERCPRRQGIDSRKHQAT